MMHLDCCSKRDGCLDYGLATLIRFRKLTPEYVYKIRHTSNHFSFYQIMSW